MNLYGLTPYNVGSLGWQGQQFPYAQQSFGSSPTFPQGQSAFGQQYSSGGVNPQGFPQGLDVPGSLGNVAQLAPDYSGIGQRSGHISPEGFGVAPERTGRGIGGISPLDGIFVTELARSARGLQEVAEQLEGRDPESNRRGHFAATAHVFYVFGVLSSKGIFIPSDLPGRTRTEGIGAATACRELGRTLERLVDKYATGQNVLEEISQLMDRGKVCYQEISRGIETVTGPPATGHEGEQPRRKVA